MPLLSQVEKVDAGGCSAARPGPGRDGEVVSQQTDGGGYSANSASEDTVVQMIDVGQQKNTLPYNALGCAHTYNPESIRHQPLNEDHTTFSHTQTSSNADANTSVRWWRWSLFRRCFQVVSRVLFWVGVFGVFWFSWVF